jgi:crossover junction endodeoxyribonuclease RuvC
MLVLGIDPGIDRLGWAIMQSKPIKLIDFGVISVKTLLNLHKKLASLIKKYPDLEQASVEDLFFQTNVKTALKIGEARGVIHLTLAKHGIKTVDYNPKTIKKVITGSGSADKKQIQKMIKILLKMEDIIKPDDAADAVAIALTHIYTNPRL